MSSKYPTHAKWRAGLLALVAVMLLGQAGARSARAPNPPGADGALQPLKPVATAKPVTPAALVTPSRKQAALPPSAASSAAVVPPSRCNEEDAVPSASGRAAGGLETSDADPRAQLLSLMDAARERSRTVGAMRLLREAADAEIREAKAGALPSASVVGMLNGVQSSVRGVEQTNGGQGRLNLNVIYPLYDAGRVEKLTEWRVAMAEAARLGQSSVEEQLALQTVSLALDRSRYLLVGQIYKQYARKMACLVDALEIITKADRGRASELVQAQKSLQQAELAYEQNLTTLRQTEVRMRRLVGDKLPPSASMSVVLTKLPDLAELERDILEAPDVAQANAQAQAQRSYAESVRAGQKPSVNLSVIGAAVGGQGRSTDWAGGVSVNIPLLQPGADYTLSAAQRRAEAALLQRDEAIEAKRYRLIEMNDAATASLDRARRVVEILRNSDRVRASTLQQWQQLGRRSLFDVMAAEGDYYGMRVAHVSALYDTQQVVAMMWSMGRGVGASLR
jgi:outer membrane protein TolC